VALKGSVMDTDLFLVLGILAFALAIPTLLSAWVDGRVPRVGSVMVLIGGVLLVTALTRNAGGYSFSEIPQIFLQVLGRYLN
jgi:formate-dependent nitrite reductase membrane component NrfD